MNIALVTCSWFPEGALDDRPLVSALARRGVTVTTPAWDDPGVDWSMLDAVVLRSTWDYPIRLPEFLAWAERISAVTRLIGGLAALRWNTDKTYLADLAADGLPIIPTRWLSGPVADLAGLLAADGLTTALCKPLVGAGSQGTRRLTGTPQDAAFLSDLIAATGGAMLQPYRSAVESDGEVSAILIDGTLSHSLRKTPLPGDYRVQEMFGARDAPCALSPAQAALVSATTEAVAARLGASPLVMRVDLLTGPDGPELCEVELVEPCLFFRHHLPAADTLAEALLRRLGHTPILRPPPTPRWPVVIFDLDGTVLDSSGVVVTALNTARADLGLPPVAPDRIRAGIGLPLRGMVAMLSAPGEDVDAITAGYREHYIDLAARQESAFDGMKELIVDLAAAGVSLGIATGKSQHGAEHAAHRHNLDHWVPAVHGILPDTPGKPDPAVLRRALADLAARPDQAALVGDTTYDMALTTALGADAIGVTWGVHEAAALREAGAGWIVSDVAALRRLLLPSAEPDHHIVDAE